MSSTHKRHTSIDDQSSSASESDSWSIFNNFNLKIPRGLHCGPGGRKALVKWLEDNYRTSESNNPAVEACKIWQETQGFRDEVCKGYVGLLKLLGFPRNVTYKILFFEYLSKQFLDIIERGVSQSVLSSLARRMINMFQVRQVQPLFAAVLCRLEEIPEDIMLQIVDDTPWANDFFKICDFALQQRLWKYRPDRFHEMIRPILRKIALLLSSEISATSRLFDHNRPHDQSDITTTKLLQQYISKQLSQLAEIVGKPGEAAYSRYDLLIKSIRKEFLNICNNIEDKSTIYPGYYSLIRLLFFDYYQSLHPNENAKTYEPKSGFLGFLILLLNLGPNSSKILGLLRSKILLPTDKPPGKSGRYRMLDEYDLFEVSMLFSSPHILFSMTMALGHSLSNILETSTTGHTWLGFVLLGINSINIGKHVQKLENKHSKDSGGFYLGRLIDYITQGTIKVEELDSGKSRLNSLQAFIVQTVPTLELNKLAQIIKFIYEYFECERFAPVQLKKRYVSLTENKTEEECREVVLEFISNEIFKLTTESESVTFSLLYNLILLRIISVGYFGKSECLVHILFEKYVDSLPSRKYSLGHSYIISAVISCLETKYCKLDEDVFVKLFDFLLEEAKNDISTAILAANSLRILKIIPKLRERSSDIFNSATSDLAAKEFLLEEWNEVIQNYNKSK